MDRKGFIILLLGIGFVFGVWNPLINKLYPPIELPPQEQTKLANSTNTNGTEAVLSAASTNSLLTTNEAFRTSGQIQEQAAQNKNAQTNQNVFTLSDDVEENNLLVLENDEAKYTFSGLGGGIRQIEMKKYPSDVQGFSREKTHTENELLVLNGGAAVPILTVLGDDTNLLNKPYRMVQKDSSTVEASQLLSSGAQLTKTITLSTNYLFHASITISNSTDQPIKVPSLELVTGNAGPLNRDDRGDLVNVSWYNGSDLERIGENWFANRTLGCSVNERRTLYTGGDGRTNVMWVSCANRFFTVATIPQEGAPTVAIHEAGLAPNYQSKGLKHGFQASLIYPERLLSPGEELTMNYEIYAGPKEYKTLAKLGISNDLDLVMDFNGFFGFFSKMLLLGMNWVHSIFHVGYGLAIIIITIFIKLIFWPLTAASTRSMKRMGQLQPEMNALREKYKDDPKKMNQKLMEFMRENKVNPMGGCWPILIQIPVFIGFYKMLMSAIELRGASFLWAVDLSSPDTIFVIPGIGLPVNPLPLLMGASMLWQTSMTPASPGMDPVQQKMFRYMPLIFIVFCYSLPSGLSLYWTVQNLFSILQMKLTHAKTQTDGGEQKPLNHALPQPSVPQLGSKKKKKR